MEIDVRRKRELERLLGLFEAGELSGPLTVARLLLVSRDVASIERWLAERVAPCTGVRDKLLHLIAQHRHGCQCVAALREGHGADAGRERALGIAPDLADTGKIERVALMERATHEIVERFEHWGLLGAARRTLELGCGAGRLQAVLSAKVALAAGVDASSAMIARARWCCSRLPNTRHEVGHAADLSAFGAASLQLVYTLQNSVTDADGDDRVTNAFAEVARVLAPGGAFVILDFSSRPEGAVDGCDVARLARDHGFEVVASGERAFRSRDGVTYRLQRCG
jgi:SAM-dependent methyltransferase